MTPRIERVIKVSELMPTHPRGAFPGDSRADQHNAAANCINCFFQTFIVAFCDIIHIRHARGVFGASCLEVTTAPF